MFHCPECRHTIAKKGGGYSLVVRTGEKEKQFSEQLASLYHNKSLPKLHNEYVVGLRYKPLT